MIRFRKVLENKELFKRITIILFILCLSFSFILITQLQKEYYTFGTMKIEKQQLKDLSNAVNSDGFLLCKFDNGDCIPLWKVKE